MTNPLDGNEIGVCPQCGKDGEQDPDGFYCEFCDSYWDLSDYNERWDEISD
jgi:hypothetical protein